MYKNKISLSGIIARLLKNPLLEELSEDDAIESALDCIALIGTEQMLIKQTSEIFISNYRGAIPQDTVWLEAVRYKNGITTNSNINSIKSVSYEDSNTGTIYEVESTLGDVIGKQYPSEYGEYIPMRPASGTFSLSSNRTSNVDLTYDIKGNFIYTSFNEGIVEVSYTTLNNSETGELLLPDDINVIKAVESYIVLKFLEPLWMMGKIADKVYQKFDQDYCWYVAKAQTSTRELSLDERESLSNMLTTLIDNRDHRSESYSNLTQPEYRIRH